METLQGQKVEGKCISLNPVEELSAQCVVIFKNLEKVATETGLRELLSRSGNVTTLKIQKDEKGCSLGYGFATFSDPSGAEAALQHNGKTIGSKVFHIVKIKSYLQGSALLRFLDEAEQNNRSLKGGSTTLFVMNISANVDPEHLENFFAPCGDVVRAWVTEHVKGRRIGFVTFRTAAMAKNGLKMNGLNIGENPVNIGVARPVTESEARV